MAKNINIYFKQLQQNKTQRNFKKIFELSHTQLFAIIFRILRKKELSEDCMQEVYVKIWHKTDTFNQDKANAMTWMSVIARNHAIDFLRKHELPIVDDFELSVISDEQLNMLQTLENQQLNQQLNLCLQQLKPEVMQVLLMSYFNGLTYKSIAKTLNTPLNTVKTWVRRAMPILKKCLEKANV